MRGFDDRFMVPHSRHTTVDRADIERVPELRILASSEEAGELYEVIQRPEMQKAHHGALPTAEIEAVVPVGA